MDKKKSSKITHCLGEESPSVDFLRGFGEIPRYRAATACAATACAATALLGMPLFGVLSFIHNCSENVGRIGNPTYSDQDFYPQW